jgi:hypothetical protein
MKILIIYNDIEHLTDFLICEGDYSTFQKIGIGTGCLAMAARAARFLRKNV